MDTETNQELANLEIDLSGTLENIDLTTVDRSFPVIKEGSYPFELVKFEMKKNKAKTGSNLIVHTKLLAEVECEDGRKLKVGFPIRTYVSLVLKKETGDKKGYNPAETLADIQLCLLGEQRTGFKLSDYVGRKGMYRLKVTDDEEYGRQHAVQRWIKQQSTTGTVGQL